MNLTAAQLAQRHANVVAIAERRKAAPRATRCKRNHELTPANTYTNPGSGKRCCLTCKTDREWYRCRGLEMVA